MNLMEKIESLSDKDFLCFYCGKKAGGWFASNPGSYETYDCKACGDWTTGVELCRWKFGEDKFM